MRMFLNKALFIFIVFYYIFIQVSIVSLYYHDDKLLSNIYKKMEIPTLIPAISPQYASKPHLDNGAPQGICRHAELNGCVLGL